MANQESPNFWRPLSRRKEFKRRECCSLAPDSIWEIKSGFLRSLTWDEAGIVKTLGIWGPGEQISIGVSTVYPLQIDCLRPARLHYVSDLTHCSRQFLVQHLQYTEELLYISKISDTLTRLQKTLSWLAQRFGQPLSSKVILPLHLTHEELAELIGSTRVTVTRLMTQLQHQGEIELQNHQIILPLTSAFLGKEPHTSLEFA